MKNLVTRAELAEMLGVTKSYVTRLCNGKLAGACSGKMVDKDHPAVQAKLRMKAAGKMPKAGKPRGPAKNSQKPAETEDLPPDVDLSELPDEIQKLAHLPLFEIVRRFGTRASFEKWLTLIQKIEAINEKMLKNAETQNRLVSRDMVLGSIVEPTDAFLIKLLTDGRRTICRNMYTMCQAGEPLSEAEKKYEELMSAMIKPLKNRIAKARG